MERKSHDVESTSNNRQSFFVRILFCQNTSWQGEIQWMEGKKTRRFRSALELMMLIQEAVGSEGSAEAFEEFRHWGINDRLEEDEDGDFEKRSGSLSS